MEKSDYNNLEKIANDLLTEGAKTEEERKKECEKKSGYFWCPIEKKCKIKDDGGWKRGGINEDHHDEDNEFQINGLRKEIISQVDNIVDTDLLMKISHYIAIRKDEAMTDQERQAMEDEEWDRKEKAHSTAGLPSFSSKEPGDYPSDRDPWE